jgi:hypothetical protein
LPFSRSSIPWGTLTKGKCKFVEKFTVMDLL